MYFSDERGMGRQAAFRRIWQEPGDQLAGLQAGDLRGLIVAGWDLAGTQPDMNTTRASLSRLDTLVVVDLFLTETAKDLATIFLPAADAGRTVLGDEARIILDPVPDYVIPATVSFVAADAQFTPKTVETQSEREQLYFRVKLQAPLDLLKGIEEQVKAGLRGMGYVRVDPAAQWPAWLAVKVPPS